MNAHKHTRIGVRHFTGDLVFSGDVTFLNSRLGNELANIVLLDAAAW